MDREAKRPAGVSIGRFLRFDRNAAINVDFAAAVQAIDRVHGVSLHLPEIALINVGAALDPTRVEADAWFGYRVAVNDSILPAYIAACLGVRQRRLKILHEIGHFLDASGLPGAGFSSAASLDLTEWQVAVGDSVAFQRLKQFAHAQHGPLGRRLNEALTLDEVWARSYAQFVATRSNDDGLVADLDELRTESAGVYHLLWWTIDDFAPIDLAIENLFVRLGWMT